LPEPLTIGQLAERTGLQPATLRMWEQRHDFPHAERLPSGHRRYPETEVERVIEVLRARDGGLSLPAAIERVANGVDRTTPSIYAGLRRLRPDLHPYPVPKRLLVPVSHAIEDECSARGERAVLVGSFQREIFYRQAEERWRGFARTAEVAVALADFDELNEPENGPLEIPIERGHPLANEWAIVCDGPDFTACLAGWERPTPGERVFEMLWSVEPEVVREGARLGLALAARQMPSLAGLVPERFSDPPVLDTAAVERATAITNRMLAYIAAAA
jgi:DICT domain-containing protein/predicted DNA-binding transcriptional regulator AlpA